MKIHRQFVEVYSTGIDAWRVANYFEYLTILKSILFAIFLVILTTTGAPWWYAGLSNESIKLTTVSIAFGVVILVVLIVGLIYLVKRSKRSLKMKQSLHKLVHFARDMQTDILESRENLFPIKEMSENLASLIRDYFDALIPGKDIQVAIRLLSQTSNGTKYVTVARTVGFTAGREKTSTALDPNEGLAKALRDGRLSKSVLIINDIAKASDISLYQRHRNDEQYDDYKTLMIAPLNGWDGQRKSLIGILFVTSKDDNAFWEKHADALGLAADVSANLFGTSVKETGNALYDSEGTNLP